jgi:hypothetical protein
MVLMLSPMARFSLSHSVRSRLPWEGFEWGLRVQVVVRALPGWTDVEADAVALLVAAEERLLLALEPPAASTSQPLTLAMLQVSPAASVNLCITSPGPGVCLALIGSRTQCSL